MFGSRARLGLVVPSSNSTVEPELTAALPHGVAAYASRVFQQETNDPTQKVRTVLDMRSELSRAVRELTSLQPSAVGYACTAGSFLVGAADDRATCARLTQEAGLPVVTASRAVVTALRQLEVGTVSLATPYIDEVNSQERHFLAEEGLVVTKESGLGIVGNLPKGRLPTEATRHQAEDADAADAQAVFISCTNWHTFELLEPLTEQLGKPVVSSNSALLWALCRLAGINDPLVGLGCLRDLPLTATMEGPT